jgi:hypothetical protein
LPSLAISRKQLDEFLDALKEEIETMRSEKVEETAMSNNNRQE